MGFILYGWDIGSSVRNFLYFAKHKMIEMSHKIKTKMTIKTSTTKTLDS